MNVKEYLSKLPGTGDFLALPAEDQDKWIFMAEQTLRDHLRPRQITERSLALQLLYMYEGDGEDFAMLKRQGVESFSTEGLSVSFKSGAIAPAVLDLITRGGRGGIGSLI